jgi:hypothetical protein
VIAQPCQKVPDHHSGFRGDETDALNMRRQNLFAVRT